jgi:hypothetical protein
LVWNSAKRDVWQFKPFWALIEKSLQLRDRTSETLLSAIRYAI